MINNRTSYFESSDACLLVAIIECEDNSAATISMINATGEQINHAQFTERELHGGLERLRQAGLIVYATDAWKTTDAVKGLFPQNVITGSSFQRMELVHRALVALNAKVISKASDGGPTQSTPWAQASANDPVMRSAAAEFVRQNRSLNCPICGRYPLPFYYHEFQGIPRRSGTLWVWCRGCSTWDQLCDLQLLATFKYCDPFSTMAADDFHRLTKTGWLDRLETLWKSGELPRQLKVGFSS